MGTTTVNQLLKANQLAPFFRAAQPWVIVTIAYTAITLLMTYPVAKQMTTHLAGASNGDTLEFVWSMWWWKYSLFDLHQNPADISIINYPVGMNFPLISTMSQVFVLGLPLTSLISPTFAYNSLFLLSIILSGVSGYALARSLTQHDVAAFVGGLIWAFFPNNMGHALAGHLFLFSFFSFPLLILIWKRFFEQPTVQVGLWAALALGLAMTTHSIYLIYFILPVLLALWLFAFNTQRSAFWRIENLKAFGIVFGLCGLIAGIILGPALLDSSQGQLNFLAARGATGFAIDALTYFIPAPNNPLSLNSPLAYIARRSVLSEFESIGYLGWIPLSLAAYGAYKRRAETRVWVILGLIGAVLALGPLLKFGGPLVEVPVEDGTDKYPVLMPYALIGNLPFMRWSRTPGRISVLTLLALSVLAPYGLALIINRLKHLQQIALVAILSVLICLEYVVQFPFPTISAKIPDPIYSLKSYSAIQTVISVPQLTNDANLRSLYWQTIHERPMVGGRVYRDLPNGQLWHDYISQLLLSPEANDIVPAPTLAERLGVLTSLKLDGVLYDARADITNGAIRQTLIARLGNPISEDESVAVFQSPATALNPNAILWMTDNSWGAPEDWGEEVGRWLQGNGAIYVYAAQPHTGKLQFTGIPGQVASNVRILINGTQVAHFAVGDWAEYLTASFTFQPGLNRIEWRDETGPRPYFGDPRCAGGSLISGPYPTLVVCNTSDTAVRNLSIVVANLKFVPESTNYPVNQIGAQFSDSLRLIGFRAPENAQAGELINTSLVWQGLGGQRNNYTIFLHLLGPDGALVAQSDSEPIEGKYPTSHWADGQIVAYNVRLRVPENVSPGKYLLKLGAYSWPSLERLPISGFPAEANVLELKQIQITR